MFIYGKLHILTCLVLVVLWSFYLFSKLQEVEYEKTVFCSKCQIVDSESLRDLDQERGDDEIVRFKFVGNLYDPPIEIIEDGFWESSRDHIVVRGLAELSSIQKSVDNIFYVESSCVVGFGSEDEHSEVFGLGAQEACGVESMARAHPDRPVYILHSCPLADDFALRVPEYARVLLELHNVFVVLLDPAELSRGWAEPLPLSSTSLGLLALWQFGGTLCHLDTLVLRSLRPLGTDYCGFREDDLLLADLLLDFEPLGYGHAVVTRLLHSFSESAHSRDWAGGDESFLEQVVNEQCSELPRSEEDCNKLTIYDSTVFFLVESNVVEFFLSENFAAGFVDRIKQTAFTITYFSRLLSFSEDEDSLTSAYALAKEFCPGVYKQFKHSSLYD